MRFGARYWLQIALPILLGLALVLIGGVELGTGLRQMLGSPAWSGSAAPFGMLLLVAGIFVSAKLTPYSVQADGIWIGGTRYEPSEVVRGRSLLGVTSLRIRGLNVLVFGVCGEPKRGV